MKPTLALSILLATASAWAQTPTVVAKPMAKAANVKASPTSAKPSPSNVRVVPLAQKPAVATKPAVVAAKPAAVTVKPAVVSVTPAPVKTVAVQAGKSQSAKTSAAAVTSVKPVGTPAVKAAPAAHSVAVVAMPAPKPGSTPAKVGALKPAAVVKDPFKKQAPVVAANGASTVVAVQDTKAAVDKKPEPKKINAAGRRDPFVSPVVNLGAVGSGCSSGKRCLAIDQIALRGVVKSDTGMIAVVVNAMDKAYFLRENDPVFNGYVVKITGDSIVFKENFKDKLGKPLTRDVTKSIARPVA